MFSAELRSTHAGVGASVPKGDTGNQEVGTYIRRQLVMSCVPISIQRDRRSRFRWELNRHGRLEINDPARPAGRQHGTGSGT